MKTLTTEQQQSLLSLLEDIEHDTNVHRNSDTSGELRYWLTELKPKRIRKQKEITDGTTSLDLIQA